MSALTLLAFMALAGVSVDWPWWMVAVVMAVFEVSTSPVTRAFWRGLTGQA